MMKQAQDWPVAEGRVLGNGQSCDADGIFTVTLTYTFKLHDGPLVLTSRSHSPVKTMRNGLSQHAEDER